MTSRVLSTDCVEEIDAQRVYGYALFKDGKRIRLAYPLEKFHEDVSGRSFHNGRFIQRMREKAASLPKYVLSFIYASRCYGPLILLLALPRLMRNSMVLIAVSEIVLVYVKTK